MSTPHHPHRDALALALWLGLLMWSDCSAGHYGWAAFWRAEARSMFNIKIVQP